MLRETRLCYFFIALHAFTLLEPYYLWPASSRLLIVSPLIAICVLFRANLAFSKIKINNAMIIILILLYFYLRDIYAQESLLRVLMFTVNSVLFFMLYTLKTAERKKTWTFFIYIFSISLIPAIIIYFARHFLDIPFTVVNAQNPLKTYTYLKFPGAIFANVGTFLGFRLHGVFDEPGLLGTYASIVLILDDFRHRWACSLILIAGILTFSLAFYVLLSILIIKQGKIKVIVLVVCLCIIFIKGMSEVGSSPIQEGFFYRFSFSKESGLAGNNRDNDQSVKNFNNMFLKDNNFIFGNGYFASNRDGAEGKASIRTFMYNYGVLGLLAMYAVYMVIMFPARNYFLFLVVILSSYQRPSLYLWGYVFLFSLGVPHLNRNIKGTDGSQDTCRLS